MPFPAGTLLGPYQLISFIGAGAMGEVYRASDPRLHRQVAIKILPSALSSDPARLRRFEQEARSAAALTHPNILAVHDVGAFEGTPYIVSELLEGETLRGAIDRHALTTRKAIDYAIQIAHGLAAAHAHGIVHRDLKPANLFVTSDGRVKILDFGLAKLATQPEAPAAGSRATTLNRDTEPGLLLGTVGYMAPEQVRGLAADARADLFALGAILFEMLTGRRAFAKETPADTMSAILTEDPPELSRIDARLPPALDRIVRHCLEKAPEQRFQSARDLAFDLEALSAESGAVAAPAVRAARAGRRLPSWALVPALAAGILIALAAMALRSHEMPSVPYYDQMTFRRGTVLAARFAADGRTIVYGADWTGSPVNLYSIQSANVESRDLAMPGTDLLSVSSTGELAVSLRRRHTEGFTFAGTLARVPLGGSGPRELLDDVEWADWSPDGSALAVIREVAGQTRIEYPIGTVLYSTAGWLSDVRVSPEGDRVAFIDHPYRRDDAGSISVVDRSGHVRVLGGSWLSAQGLAWSGGEIWFTAAKEGSNRALYAVTLAGAVRPLASSPGLVTLRDVSRDGRALLTRDTMRLALYVRPPGANAERDLSWLDWSRLRGISPDGRQVLFDETGQGGGARQGVYIRAVDGSPAVRLGDGTAEGFSPDGRWVISLVVDRSEIVLLPAGAGEARTLNRGPLASVHRAYWFPDGQRLLIDANQSGHAGRLYIQDLAGGTPKPITPEGVSLDASISPDGRWVAARRADGQPVLFSTSDGTARPVEGIRPPETISGWSADGGGLYVYDPSRVPIVLDRVDLSTGARQDIMEIAAPDASPLFGIQYLFVTPDLKEYAYATLHQDSDLYLVTGLK